MDFLFRFILVAFLIFANGFFVAAEFALVSVRRTRVQELVSDGDVTAREVQRALSNLDHYISATQLGITIASIGLGWIGEPALAQLFENFFGFLQYPWIIVAAHSIAVTVAFSLITIMHVVLGELVPKTLALAHAERMSFVIIRPLIIFSTIFSPFINLLNWLGSLVLKVTGLSESATHREVYSEEEIKMLLQESGEEGEIPFKEVEMIENVFRLNDLTVADIMAFKGDVHAVSDTATLDEVIAQAVFEMYSRVPVVLSRTEKAYGYVHVRDVYQYVFVHGGDKMLKETGLIRAVIDVLPTDKIDYVLSRLRKSHVHLAVVRGEKGKMIGVVTMEDILERLVGEIEDEFDASKG